MKSDLKILWLYLAKRDKKGVKILSKFYARDMGPLPLEDLKLLNLPSSWYGKVKTYIDENMLYWQPWLQTATSFEELKYSLKIRGYSELPANGRPMVLVTPTLFVNSNFFEKQKVMLKKN